MKDYENNRTKEPEVPWSGRIKQFLLEHRPHLGYIESTFGSCLQCMLGDF